MALAWNLLGQNPSGLPLDFKDVSPREVDNLMPPPEEIETEDDDDLGLMSPGGAGPVGIKVVSSIEDIRVEGVEGMGVEVVGLPLLDTDAFHERMGRFWGRAPDMDTVNAVTREIILYYREQGFRVVDATLPGRN